MNCRRIKVITSFGELDAVRAFWESEQWHPGADYEFFRMIAQTRKEVLSPCVLAVFEGENMIALLAGRLEQTHLPIRFAYTTLARISLRQLILVEGGFMGNRTSEIWEFILGYLQQLFHNLEVDRIVIEQVRIGSIEQETVLRRIGRGRLSGSGVNTEHWLMQIPASWDDFLKGRSKKHRYWIKRLSGVLDREFPGKWSIKVFARADEVSDFAQSSEAVSSKTYQRGLGVGFRLQEEAVRRLQQEADYGLLRGYVLYILGEPKAFWYCFVYGSTLYLAATGYDPAFRDYEIGTVLLMRVFQDHCGTKIKTVDFGLGDAGYKQRFGTEKYYETVLFLFPNSIRGYALNALQLVTTCANKSAKALLVRFRVIQQLKTRWRRKIERKLTPGADSESNNALLETVEKPNR